MANGVVKTLGKAKAKPTSVEHVSQAFGNQEKRYQGHCEH